MTKPKPESTPMKNTESAEQFAERAATETFYWLKNRSHNCHPVMFDRDGTLLTLTTMLAEHLAPRQPSDNPALPSSTRLAAELTEADAKRVMLLMMGFAFGRRAA